MTHEERARKIANRINSQKFSGLLEDLLVAQFAEVEAPWTETYNACHNAGGYIDQIRRLEFDAVSLRHHIDNQKARIALLEAALERAEANLFHRRKEHINDRCGRMYQTACEVCDSEEAYQAARAKVKP